LGGSDRIGDQFLVFTPGELAKSRLAKWQTFSATGSKKKLIIGVCR
jgi:hypothetical protein